MDLKKKIIVSIFKKQITRRLKQAAPNRSVSGPGALEFLVNNQIWHGLIHAFEQAKSWGGKIEITSEEGKGTRVRLVIPALA